MYSLWLLIGFIISKSAKVCSVSGIVWGRFIFILSAGITHTLFLKSISCQRAVALSIGLVIVCSCHSSKHRVASVIFAFAIACMSSGSLSGSIVTICWRLGAGKSLVMSAK
ncbi:Uncharacterised protein [Vibrio cholerae]|nr:Uncharacterised protein [Vibrio cholerae]CSI58418.1 Uncharacterised protein [Vibrio cholerae]